ncbi:hypothetical protein [Helicobacter sp. T3_23-1059]
MNIKWRQGDFDFCIFANPISLVSVASMANRLHKIIQKFNIGVFFGVQDFHSR